MRALIIPRRLRRRGRVICKIIDVVPAKDVVYFSEDEAELLLKALLCFVKVDPHVEVNLDFIERVRSMTAQ